MFATLLGGLPAPLDEDGRPVTGVDAQFAATIRAQEEAGLEPITDGRLRDPGFDRLANALASSDGTPRTVEAWRHAASLTEYAVKQALPGPYTLARRSSAPGREREQLALAIADALRAEVEALAAAGCPLIEIEEAEAHLIGDDGAERRIFRAAHRRLAEDSPSTHLSLSIVGGSADGAGAATILDAPYHSFAFDLIAGPDNWRLAAAVPGDRGVIAGALSAAPTDQPKELLLWAARYAASTGGRGLDRVGLGTAGGLAGCDWEVAVRKMTALGAAARLAATPPGPELARQLDPRAVSPGRAVMGRRRRASGR